VTENYYDWRDQLVASKQGVQSSEDTTTHRPILYYTLDNLGEITETQHFDGDGVTITSTNGVPNPPSASLLREESKTAYDEQGRPYQTITFDVNQSNGTVSSTGLTTNYYYSHRGLAIETSNPGGLVEKQQYDGAARMIEDYQTDGASGTSWSSASSVSNDNVLEQTDTQYDAAGNVLVTSTRQRFDNETTLGALGNPTTAPKARVSYVGMYYNAANRLTTTVDVGTNGGSAWTRPSTPPGDSDTVLVTSYGYAGDSVQMVQLSGSPTGGTFTLTWGGQTTSAIAYNASAATVQSALQGLSSIGSGNALVAGGTSGGPWVVRFAGTLAGAAQPALTGNGSGLTGGSSPNVAITVTSLGGDAGWQQQVTDPRGIVTKTDYDSLGRTARTVENFIAFNPSNSADKTTEYTYDGDGNQLTLKADEPSGASETTQFVYGVTTGSGGSTVNSNDILAATQYPDPTTGNPSSSQQETYTVDALGERLTYSDRNGNVHTYVYDVLGRQTSDQVTTLGSGVDNTVLRIDTAYDTADRPYLYTSYSTTAGTTIVNQVEDLYNGLGQLITEYQSHTGAVNTNTTPNVQYTYVDLAGGANNSRLTSMTYPNGRQITYNYNTGLDSTISRLSSISDSSATLESYKYLGLHTVVERDHPQPGVNLTYIDPNGSTGDAGDKYTGLDRFGRVVDQRWYVPSTSTYTGRFQYGYDRDSNRLYRDNLVNTAFGELYHVSGSGNGYDQLNQLIGFARGTLNASKDTIVGTASRTSSWSLDALGNFASVTTNGTQVSRTHNQQNEVTAVGGSTLTFDKNGNTTTDDQGHTLSLDAWNRLVTVKNGSTVLEAYTFDALGRRVTENPGTLRDIYFSTHWQVLEEDVSGSMQDQYVWSPVYVDALVDRDTPSQRLYVQQDANWNVTALINTTGSAVERYLYDPYGAITYLTAAWGSQSGSAYSWVYLYQGARFDTSTNLYVLRHRDYSSTLGRWLEIDPAKYGSGNPNLYSAFADSPITRVDPTGLVACGPDVTDWFVKEIALFRKAAEDLFDALHSELPNPDDSLCVDPGSTESIIFTATARFLLKYKRLSRLADYKMRNERGVEPFDYSKCKDPDKNTVTLCGVCIGTNQLGNIIYGIIAVEANVVQESRDFGLGNNPLGGPKPPWTAPGEAYRMLAFELGVDFETDYRRRGSKVSICDYVKARAQALNGSQYNTTACTKVPCKFKHSGPNTDMNRDPLTDEWGNRK
jgi:RHS repeat-associated protein